MEAFFGWFVFVTCQAGMSVRFLSSQRMKSNLVCGQIHVGADQPSAPDWAHVESVSQDGGLARLVGDSYEDHGPLQGSLQVEFPVLRKVSPLGSIFDPNRVTFPMSAHEACGLHHNLLAVFEG